jgi:hypothetical protein
VLGAVRVLVLVLVLVLVRVLVRVLVLVLARVPVVCREARINLAVTNLPARLTINSVETWAATAG